MLDILQNGGPALTVPTHGKSARHAYVDQLSHMDLSLPLKKEYGSRASSMLSQGLCWAGISMTGNVLLVRYVGSAMLSRYNHEGLMLADGLNPVSN